ncbi:PREDICTED: 4-nitrophenylphosphatase-like [Nicrophorus vespilloides]|uniref:4-nitrophenylphosphatase-like n=1 Tax=Nicrophorus vespilloides TaxID=110193 RepID=A0ABM1MVL1_NICVS|nr:PREDICTED: 4-nitrophenylphosphatase-like [Nicrophorus vespilloides]
MSTPKDLSQIPADELKQFVDSFDDVFCDCDGVIFILMKVFDGVPDTISTLKSLGKSIRYVTNNSSMLRDDFAKKLQKQGIECEKDDIINPCRAIIDHLKAANFEKKVYMISLPSLRQEFEESGIKIANKYGAELCEVNATSFLQCIQEYDNDVGAVVVCFDFNMTYLNLNRALRYITNPDVKFLATGYDQRIIFSPNQFCMGPAFFHDLLQSASGRTPIWLGKPRDDFVEYIKNQPKCNPERTLFIGDSLEQDMGFAHKLGFTKLLVLTGNTTLEDLKNCDKEMLPDYYISSMAELGKLLKNNF